MSGRGGRTWEGVRRKREEEGRRAEVGGPQRGVPRPHPESKDSEDYDLNIGF